MLVLDQRANTVLDMTRDCCFQTTRKRCDLSRWRADVERQAAEGRPTKAKRAAAAGSSHPLRRFEAFVVACIIPPRAPSPLTMEAAPGQQTMGKATPAPQTQEALGKGVWQNMLNETMGVRGKMPNPGFVGDRTRAKRRRGKGERNKFGELRAGLAIVWTCTAFAYTDDIGRFRANSADLLRA